MELNKAKKGISLGLGLVGKLLKLVLNYFYWVRFGQLRKRFWLLFFQFFKVKELKLWKRKGPRKRANPWLKAPFFGRKEGSHLKGFLGEI